MTVTYEGRKATIELWSEANNKTSGWDSYKTTAEQWARWATEEVDLVATHRSPAYDVVSLYGAGMVSVEDAERYAAAILTVCKKAREWKEKHSRRTKKSAVGKPFEEPPLFEMGSE